jgi:hypothetical protein
MQYLFAFGAGEYDRADFDPFDEKSTDAVSFSDDQGFGAHGTSEYRVLPGWAQYHTGQPGKRCGRTASTDGGWAPARAE